jgi:uncharacterized protein DUF4255
VFIHAIDESLERLLRAQLPFPADAGDVSFAAPTVGWGDRVGRPTVNLFLYEIKQSARPSASTVRRTDMDGRPQQRRPSPVLELNYLISAWAKSPLAEHRLLGEVAGRLSVQATLPSARPADDGASPVQLIFGGDGENKLRDIWSAAGGRLKASFTLSVVTAIDAFAWTDQAPLVTEVVRGIGRRP